MKKIKFLLLATTLLVLSCEENIDFTNNKFAFIDVANDEYDFTVTLGETGNFSIPVFHSFPLSSTETFSVTVDEENSTYTANAYNIASQITIAQGENQGNIQIEAGDAIDSTGEVLTLIIDGDSVNNPASVTLNMSLFCPVTGPSPGTWILRTRDTFGDGWAYTAGTPFVTITVDGVAQNFTNAGPGRADIDFPFDVSPGASEMTISFDGDGEFWTSEVRFQLLNPDGEVVLSEVSYPNNTAFVDETPNLNYCIF
ncbi:hypothetical protein Q4Q34_01980 [Flavivirga abyssicola]|uniref:hypothetical protein n=1 Tax=Flavivirga abyssicola TaxID=3063533 RepID=UPI0026DF7918|nr:hypothetical protein [Flavivirga sp. MEBiC07777]WVK13809.1 hypothetical protein Q4Q34_01980 [Flavivirga sp. MEBiC07777]